MPRLVKDRSFRSVWLNPIETDPTEPGWMPRCAMARRTAQVWTPESSATAKAIPSAAKQATRVMSR